MPDRLASIDRIIVNMERKGATFLETLHQTGQFDIEVGKMKVLTDKTGRAYFLQRTNGLPVWFDVTLTSTTDHSVETGIDYLVFDYEQEYVEVRQRQLEAARTNRPLDATDALEALVLAEVTKDTAVAETLIFRLDSQLPEVVDMILPRLGRGSSRVRSAFGRIVALNDQPNVAQALLDYLTDEAAPGVRADIIITYIQANAARGDLPKGVVQHFLAEMELTDALSTVTALAAVNAPVPPSLLAMAAPAYKSHLAGWFTDAA